MDLASLGAFTFGAVATLLSVAAFIVGRRDRARAATERAAETERHDQHDDRTVAVAELELAVRWQADAMRDLRQQLTDERAHCDEEITTLRGQVARLQARVDELERSQP